ncbi:MAG TPA: protoporphyrinogen oxidase [Actinomycetota bacterium]|nr:protoporphyrinogen oxidase [Actinomycetota bacterium]
MAVVAVAGGGITGLVTARAVLRAGLDVVLLEAGDDAGGKIVTKSLGGVAVEGGPDSFLARDEWGVELCRSIGLGNELVSPAVFGGLVWSRGRLHPLPRGLVSGIPTLPFSILRTGLLSRRGALRAVTDLFNSKPLTGRDVSVGALVRDRLGDEVLERLVDPLLAGTRAGDADEMSLAAAAPDLDMVARRHRSLILGLRTWGPDTPGKTAPPVFMAPIGGMSRIVGALKTELHDADVRYGSAVESVARDGKGFRLETRSGDVRADGVVLAAPAYAAARQVAALDPGASQALASIPYASVAVVALLYPRSAGAPPAKGSGMLVPRVEGRTIAACTWYSTKWPTSAPADGFLLRAVVGRSGRHPALDLADDELVAAVHEDLAGMLGLKGQPTVHLVTRWERGLPQYLVGHLDRVTGAELALAQHGPLFLAGAGYRGSGIPDCIKGATEVAAAVVNALA